MIDVGLAWNQLIIAAKPYKKSTQMAGEQTA